MVIIMSLFNFNKKETKPCCCGGNCNEETMQNAVNVQGKGVSVKILGSGCAKCNKLEANTVEALKQLGIDTTIEHITDFSQIASYGVMTTPAIVYNGKVISYGKVLKPDEIFSLLQKEDI